MQLLLGKGEQWGKAGLEKGEATTDIVQKAVVSETQEGDAFYIGNDGEGQVGSFI